MRGKAAGGQAEGSQMKKARIPIKLFLVLTLSSLAFPADSIARSPTRQRAQPCCQESRPVPSYAGDCGPNPPPGYRHDLKDLVTGFSRDFSCYVLDEY
ncbi:hypothetical protein AMST5_02252 [freshwater sediment metagenome]|uniref:Uncharacterized protein n=1 Tax=freshwater sediment metagenome TaxID=556182 RepID=A0AA48M2E6_9ZZZZ